MKSTVTYNRKFDKYHPPMMETPTEFFINEILPHLAKILIGGIIAMVGFYFLTIILFTL